VTLATPTTPAEWLCLLCLLALISAAALEAWHMARAHERRGRARDAARDAVRDERDAGGEG